ncbi:MAG TPA: hypothetical protein VFR08_05840 [Candidatus Angelobacter sp.]|nr:hypothetical protein [Candidatus Angelobacter sp.]
MFHGVQGEYRWIESASHGIEDVLRVCPEVAIGKSWAVTAFDKEKLAAVLDDNLQSWQVSGSALLIPPVADLSQAPYNIFSEWYTFSGTVPQHKFYTFVRHPWFSLGPAAMSPSHTNTNWDLKRMQRLFWQEMEAAAPESYISSGQRLIFVSRNAGYFSAVLRGLGGTPIKTGTT